MTREVANILKDASKLHQKINRHVEPHITTLRSKEFRIESKVVVAILVPQSVGVTHLVSKVGSFSHTSGKEKTVLHQGTFYVRRSAGNHLGDSRDLDGVIERRIDQFRSALMDKFARVINSPATSEVFILSKDANDNSGQRFIIEDSPASIPVKGMSFTVPPDGPEEEIAAWSVLYRGDSNLRPPESVVWSWYKDRESLELNKQYRLILVKFALWNSVPVFFWMQGLKAKDLKEVILECIRNRPPGVEVKPMLVAAAFMGKPFYNTVLKVLGSYIDRIAVNMKKFPSRSPKIEFGSFQKSSKQTLTQLKAEKRKSLNEIAAKAAMKTKCGLQDRWTAQIIDCFLYAQDNQYK